MAGENVCVEKMIPNARTLIAALCFGLLFVAAACAQEFVFVIRHAEQVPTGSDPELLPEGYERANAWARVLEPAGLTGVVTSDQRRSVQTGTVIADTLDVPLRAFGKHEYDEMADYIRGEHSEGRVLIVGHSGTISSILRSLEYEGYETVSKSQYGELCVVSPRGGAAPVLRLRID